MQITRFQDFSSPYSTQPTITINFWHSNNRQSPFSQCHSLDPSLKNGRGMSPSHEHVITYFPPPWNAPRNQWGSHGWWELRHRGGAAWLHTQDNSRKWMRVIPCPWRHTEENQKTTLQSERFQTVEVMVTLDHVQVCFQSVSLPRKVRLRD